jgi:putative FmdB family regulatory protein
MPTYEYQCKACGHTLEEFHSITDPPLTRCPRCDTDNLVRIMGTGGGLIFRGTGFYLTDYKKSGGSPSSSAGKPGNKPSGEKAAGKPSGESSGSKPSGDSPGGTSSEGGSGGSSTPGGSGDTKSGR